MTEEEKELLRISYSNNERLIQIDNELRINVEIRDDLENYFKDKDLEFVWITTVTNLILATGIGTVLLKYGLDFRKSEDLFLILSILWIVFGVIEYKTQKLLSNENLKIIEEKYDITKGEKYKLINIEKQITYLNKLKNQIISEEIEIKKEFEKIKK